MLGYVGTYTCTLRMPWVTNLKEKRALVRPVVERLKSRYPVSVARLDGLNTHDWETIGVVTISNDHGWVEETLAHVAAFIAQGGEYRIEDEHQEITPLGDNWDDDD